ncbi:MAG TPA: 23S rRNA (uracil(1939)-C(5))-methyltransferase RlmD [Terriglobales bacterium]|nr:23S rRNA (uracil(1939)-C(5))-methyltransferase RlmD [Terriglobales bacterium]
MLFSVEKLVYGGDGLARLPADEHGQGKAVFIPFVLEGERIEGSLLEEKPGFARARADHVRQASPHRVEPRCPYFGACGGCHYQHSSYEHQLEIKAAILKETLRRTAKIEPAIDIVAHASPAWNYRNRARLRMKGEPEFALGYYRFHSTDLLPIEQCPISSPLINRAIAALWRMGRAGNLPRALEEVEIFANAEDDRLLLELYGNSALTPASATTVGEAVQSALPEVVGVAWFRSALRTRPGRQHQTGTFGSAELSYHTQQFSYKVSAGAFFQGNRYLTEELIRIVTNGCSGTLALDLYAGVGLFSARLSRSFAQVFAVESSSASYADLRSNAAPNVRTVHSSAEQFLRRVGKLRPDLVVVDPPRSGLSEAVIGSLQEVGARRIIYVSCDPATLSRDLQSLLQAGYAIQQAHLVDLFPQTYHIESVFQVGMA